MILDMDLKVLLHWNKKSLMKLQTSTSINKTEIIKTPFKKEIRWVSIQVISHWKIIKLTQKTKRVWHMIQTMRISKMTWKMANQLILIISIEPPKLSHNHKWVSRDLNLRLMSNTILILGLIIWMIATVLWTKEDLSLNKLTIWEPFSIESLPCEAVGE